MWLYLVNLGRRFFGAVLGFLLGWPVVMSLSVYPWCLFLVFVCLECNALMVYWFWMLMYTIGYVRDVSRVVFTPGSLVRCFLYRRVLCFLLVTLVVYPGKLIPCLGCCCFLVVRPRCLGAYGRCSVCRVLVGFCYFLYYVTCPRILWWYVLLLICLCLVCFESRFWIDFL